MSSRRGIIDTVKYGAESETYLSELMTNVKKKVANLDKFMKRFQRLHDKYKLLITHLYDENKFDLCEHHVTHWMMMILFMHDKSQLIQTGRFQFGYQLEQKEDIDEICPDKFGDFSWDDCGAFELNMTSVQGYKYQHDIVQKFMKPHDAKYVAKMLKAFENNLSWEQVQIKLREFDTGLKRMIKELELVGMPAHIVFKVCSTHGKEVLEVRLNGQVKKFDRKGHFALLMKKGKCDEIVASINTENVIDMQGDSGYTRQFFALHLETTAAEAEEAAAAIAELKRLAAERTAADVILQAELRKEKQETREKELITEKKAAKQREMDKVTRQFQRSVNAVVKKTAAVKGKPALLRAVPAAAPRSSTSSRSSSGSNVPPTEASSISDLSPTGASSISDLSPTGASSVSDIPPTGESSASDLPSPHHRVDMSSAEEQEAAIEPDVHSERPSASSSRTKSSAPAAVVARCVPQTNAVQLPITVSTQEDEMEDDDIDVTFPLHTRMYKGLTEQNEEVIDDDADNFIAAEGRVRMRRNRDGHLEENTDEEDNVEEEQDDGDDDDFGPSVRKRRKRMPTTNPILLNSALAEYLFESGRRQQAAELMADGAVDEDAQQQSGGNGDETVGSVGDRVITPAEMADVAPGAVQARTIDGGSIIHRMYDKLNYKDVMAENSTKSRTERNRAIDIAYCEVVVNDVCDTVMKNHYRDQNCAAYWYHKRVANEVGDEDVAEIERHMWKLFFIEVKALALDRVLIKPQLVARPDIGGKPSTPLTIPLLAGEQAKNELRVRAVNTAISKLAKKIIFVYETLNERLLQLPLEAFKGCGFVLPTKNSSMDEVFHSIELDSDNVLQLIVSKEFDLAEYEDFKEVVMTKKNRDDLKTHAQKLEKKRAEKAKKAEETAAKKSETLPVVIATSLLQPGMSSSSALQAANGQQATGLASSDKRSASDEEALDALVRDVLASPVSHTNTVGGGLHVSPSVLSTVSSVEHSPSSNNLDLSSLSLLFDTPLTSSVSAPIKNVPFVPVDYGQVSSILKKVFNNTQGECGGLCVEHNKLKTQAHTNQRYVTDLAHIVALIAKFKRVNGYDELDFDDIVQCCKQDLIVQKQVFVVRKQFLMSDVQFAYENNTRPDGYCMWWMSLQQKLRAEGGPCVDCEGLRTHCATLRVDVDLVPHIQHYLDCVKYKEKESQDLAQAQLATVLARARDTPHLHNLFNLWGNSKLCRFIDVRLMLFCLESAKEGVDSNGMPFRAAQLSIVNHALGDMYQDGAPQFTFEQLESMFLVPMYAGFMHSHFFSLDNPDGNVEVAKMYGAYRDWLHCIVERLEGISDIQLAKIIAFDSNNKHHGVIDLADDSDDEEALTMLEGEVEFSGSSSSSSSSEVGRFSGEVSFSRKAPFKDEQRQSMFETIRLMQQRIHEMEDEMSKLKLAPNDTSVSFDGDSPATSQLGTKRKLNPLLSIM